MRMRETATVVASSFYSRPADELAPALLGCVLVRVLEDGTRLSGRIVETEAYLGVRDRAAHSFGGRRTPRNEAMYARAGTAYVYFTYGMHYCFNVVCGAVDEPVAVLVRALEPIEGAAVMRLHRAARRAARKTAPRGAMLTNEVGNAGDRHGVQRDGRASRRASALRDEELCNGPAKLCQALAIDRALNGADLIAGEAIWIEHGDGPLPASRIGRSARIGVEYAEQWAKRRLRWFVKGSRCVSGL